MIIMNDKLKLRMINFRMKRSKELNIPPQYIFTNEELDRLIDTMPKTIEELRNSNILPLIKITTHGIYIIKELNKD